MEIRELYAQAQSFGVCDKFTGAETTAQLLDLFMSPQGIEFCAKNHWPTLAQIREFKGPQAEQVGLYIDAGDIVLHNSESVVLIGNTHATFTFCDHAEMRHKIVVMHGAEAYVNACGWAVVFCYNLGGGIQKKATEHAIIR